ncbi:hypothetical protein PMAC_003403 [Pneumocystis sp. 'macacae']|nr:hypothetical protein PMAC_003403 [Pneumocystis sp. 'macacae']
MKKSGGWKKDTKRFRPGEETQKLRIEGECDHLREECGFKEECSRKDACDKIDNICKVKPLEVKEYKTETVGQEGKDIGESSVNRFRPQMWETRKRRRNTSTSTSTSTITSTVTLTSTRRCKPTRCTPTGDEVRRQAGIEDNRVERANEHGLGTAYISRDTRDEGGHTDTTFIAHCVVGSELGAGGGAGGQEAGGRGGKGTSVYEDVEYLFDFELTDEHCSNQEKCLFLENAYPDLKENCNTLRTNCYQKKREEVAEEALLRALRGNLDNNKCNEKLKEICPVFDSQQCDELLGEKCVNSEYTCQHLVQAAKDKCKLLKKK